MELKSLRDPPIPQNFAAPFFLDSSLNPQTLKYY